MMFLFYDPATSQLCTLSLHDALPISKWLRWNRKLDGGRNSMARKDRAFHFRQRFVSNTARAIAPRDAVCRERSEEHTSELQSLTNLVCRLLLEKKNG